MTAFCHCTTCSAAGMRPEGAVALAVGTTTGAKSIDHRRANHVRLDLCTQCRTGSLACSGLRTVTPQASVLRKMRSLRATPQFGHHPIHNFEESCQLWLAQQRFETNRWPFSDGVLCQVYVSDLIQLTEKLSPLLLALKRPPQQVLKSDFDSPIGPNCDRVGRPNHAGTEQVGEFCNGSARWQ